MKDLHLFLKHRWYNAIKYHNKNEEYRQNKPYYNRMFFKDGQPIKYDRLFLHKGYTKTSMCFRYVPPFLGLGRPEWGAPDYEVYILSLEHPLIIT